MKISISYAKPFNQFLAAVLINFLSVGVAMAYDPELGTTISTFPIVQTGGQTVDFSPGRSSFRVLIVSATWCEPCERLKSALPGELARLRQQGISVSTIVIEADDFLGSTGPATNIYDGVNKLGFIDAVPDPRRINLSRESPRGVRDWGIFRSSGYPTTVLLDSQNVVVDRYRGSSSRSVFDSIRSRVAKASDVVANPPPSAR